ncbi:hypothetical protein LP52_03335 [Streptomonospora alba]|uniref:Bacterial bifunctional deaminase-reductase C-terminal domain-containing protein n=1 Tax=Streptomonospora alba TaxID=183763 RepID=A0A0C2FL12_9ACTN|nr:dihydrofolate reductase family protein [Streptomonospora alba]KIH99999.1 hypothetical protein LP52_03335 [Streptomonospora alba]
MSTVFASVSVSLDGFVAGPDAGPRNPLGDGGSKMHRWVFDLEAWRERQGVESGERIRDNEIVKEEFDRAGAYVMGRRMFDEGEVAWADPPPFRAPVFVLTHNSREPWGRKGGTTFEFVTDGPVSAVEQAREAADGKDVRVSGGAAAVRQRLEAGLLDELEVHIAPVVLGAGTRLFDGPLAGGSRLEPDRVVDSPAVTHVRYRVLR